MNVTPAGRVTVGAAGTILPCRTIGVDGKDRPVRAIYRTDATIGAMRVGTITGWINGVVVAAAAFIASVVPAHNADVTAVAAR
jgi:hypothetical protein